MKSPPRFDSLHMGRSSIDLYSNDIGMPFERIQSFAAYIGGSPTNISVGMRRLGLKPALLTGVGLDPVGDFILDFLNNEGVGTESIVVKEGKRSSAVILGIEPPDKFPLVYYREGCADIELTIDDVLASPLLEAGIFQFAGTNLCREPSRSATFYAIEMARANGIPVVFDIDFRPDQWHDLRAFGVVGRAALRLVDIVLGTEDEIKAVMMQNTAAVSLSSSVSDTAVVGSVDQAIEEILGFGPSVLIQKRGSQGAVGHSRTPDGKIERVEAPGFPVEVYNILGAGEAFAAGFLFGQCTGLDIFTSMRLGNACGAIVVTKHGCANFMPTYDEVMAFANKHGGLRP